jgi:two-component system phosphate regulon sensor histidine kinase PhoR
MDDASLSPASGLFGRLVHAIRAGRAAWRGQSSPVASRAVSRPAAIADDTAAGFVAALDLPLVLLGPDLRVLAVSRGALSFMPALGEGKAVGLALRDPDALAAIESTRGTGAPSSVEITEPSPPERTFRLNVARLSRGQARSPILLWLDDLSPIRAVERLRVDFIANASHELRTPLATLLGFIETLQGPAREDAAARERFLGIMHDQGRRMSRLVDDLLSLSRIEQRAHQTPADPVDLAGILREIVDSLSVMAAERGVVVESPAATAALMVAGDRDELLRLVENLVENAIKYGRDGRRVELGLVRKDALAELTVRDFGPGIAPEHIPRLTERFYRIDVGASREAGGTGLGLAIVKHIVLRHRGRLLIESPPGEGLLVRVSLPLHPSMTIVMQSS